MDKWIDKHPYIAYTLGGVFVVFMCWGFGSLLSLAL